MSYAVETKNDRTAIQQAFNSLFNEFLEDILRIYPENIGLLTAKTTFDNFKRMNPTTIIKSWYKFVYVPYSKVIDSGNIEFFFEKDYNSELAHLRNSSDIMRLIDQVREPLAGMSSQEKEFSTVYVKNLCKLSVIYDELLNH